MSAWVGAGSMQSTPLRATPGSSKRAAGLLLTSVGWARLQGGMAKGRQGSGEAPRACGGGAQRKACAGGGGANLRMHIAECLLRQALTKASEDTWQPVRVAVGHGVMIGGKGGAGGQG